MTAAPGNAIRELYAALWRFAEGVRGQFLGATAMLTASQLIKLTLPYLAGQAINALQRGDLRGMRHDAGLCARYEVAAGKRVCIRAQAVAAGQHRAYGRYRGGAGKLRFNDGLPAAGAVAVLRPVDFGHARVEYAQHVGRAGLFQAGLGHCRERADRRDRQAGAESQSLDHAAGGANTGKRTRPRTEGDRVAVGEPDAGLGQQRLHHRQQA